MVSTVKNFDELPVMLHANHVKQVLGLSTGKAYEVMHSEGFPTQYFGKRMMVLKADFIEWLEQNKRQGSKQ